MARQEGPRARKSMPRTEDLLELERGHQGRVCHQREKREVWRCGGKVLVSATGEGGRSGEHRVWVSEGKDEKIGHVDGSVDVPIPRFSKGGAVVVGTLQRSMEANGAEIGAGVIGKRAVGRKKRTMVC